MYSDPKDPRLLAKRREHYHANKQQYIQRNKDAKAERMRWLRELKEASPCMDCGVHYPSYVMDFDHRDPSTKKGGVGKFVSVGWKSLKEEIAKCDLVCANCHRERTWGDNIAVA